MLKRSAVLAAASVLFPVSVVLAPVAPSAEITNGLIQAKLYLPNSETGFYRGTRFDWSGVVYALHANGHNYYGPWFDSTDPSVHDFIYKDGAIVAGPCSATAGPADEFAPVGYDEAQPGGTFLKIGIGALTKDSDAKYDNYHLYAIANGGEWHVTKHNDSVEFLQTLDHLASGYGYRYQKTIRLVPGKPEMVLEHHLKNTGTRPIETTVYNHNFLVLDRQPPGPGVTIKVPFTIRTAEPPNNDLARVAGHEIAYAKTLTGHDVFATPLEGFSNSPADDAIQIENRAVGAGVRWHTDRPLLRESLWSIRSVVAMEPFISVSVPPGAEFSWTTVYDYYQIAPKAK